MDGSDREGTAATLRAAVRIVVAGIALGLAFNAVGLASRPPRGLPWIRQQERMPSLEELQPASGLVPVARPRALAGLSFVGTAWAGGAPTRSVGPSSRVATSDTARAAVKPATKPAAKSAKATAKTTKAPVQPAKVTTQPVRPAIQKTTATPAPAPAAVALPAVPDLDQPIEVKLAFTKRFFDAGPAAALVVDAREPAEYAAGHVAGAQSLPYEQVAAKPELLEPFKKLGKPVILYCGVGCESSHELAKLMVSERIRKVLVFTEGFEVWQAAGYPVEKGAAGTTR